MLSVIITWMILPAYSYVLGIFVLNLIYRNHLTVSTEDDKFAFGIDECIWTGTVLLTVYAQGFSLFYRVGTSAFLIVTILFAVLLVFSLVKFKDTYRSHISIIKNLSPLQWGLTIIIILSMISWTNRIPENYDTYLYHNQAIQWLERYGIIKGLGNLHCRFAYNSAFLPLQALFSFRGLTGQSLHTVNGFYCAFSLIYCSLTNRLISRKRAKLADFLKLASIGYTCFIIPLASSPGTDTLALTLFLYICIKWNEYDDTPHIVTDRYALLCMLAVFDVTLKLSVAPCVLLALYPIINYVKQKKPKKIFSHVVIGFLIALPWLIRNVIISGYLIYPYAQIDLFDVDWKIPSSIAYIDSWKIQVRSKGYTDIAMRTKHVWDWFPGVWFVKYPGFFERFCMISGIILFTLLFIYLMIRIIKRSFEPKVHLFYGMILISFYIWFTSAPTIRYGIVFSFALFAIWLHIISYKCNGHFQKISFILKGVLYTYTALMFVYASGNWMKLSEQPLVMQADYDHIETQMHQYPEYTVWYPVGGSDLCGCNVFPSLPYPKIIDISEMRGNDISDGFRVRSDYTNRMIDMSGDIYD